jgi:hypothetical protein
MSESLAAWVGSSPEAFAEFPRQESEINGRLVRAHHIVVERT